jgi:transcription elongation regulator 1
MKKFLELESKLEELKKKKIEKPLAISNKKNDQEIKEIEMSEEEKAKQKSKPISSTPIPGTPWCVVWTRDKRVFFYNPSEKVSLWERPAALIGRIDVDRLVKEVPTTTEQSNNSTAQKKKTEAPTVLEPPNKKSKYA